MAIGTVLSRITGFLRTAALLAALGSTGVADAYNVANTTPNIIHDLLLGGILSSVVVPLLVRARREDEDAGERFTSVLFSVTMITLVAVTIVAILAAPLLMRIYVSGEATDADRALAVSFIRLFMPQLVFYALSALIGAVLNVRGKFGAVGAVPVINNLVVIAIAGIFIASADRKHLGHNGLPHGEMLLLGIGTTLGVVAMALALVPSMRAAGIRVRFIPDWREPRLRMAARLGGWVVGYAVVNQLGFLVITQLATRHGGDFTIYSTAYQLFQLPHAIIAVSVISALMPGLSHAAAVGDLAGVRHQLSRGLRLTFVFLLPAALGLAALAQPIATGALQYGATGAQAARTISDTLAAFAIGLPFFSAYQLLLRAFYAQQDSRTPTLINVVCNVVNVVAAVILALTLPPHLRVPGLAAALAVAYLVGAAVAARLLRRSLGGLDGYRVLRLSVRASLAALVAAAGARIVADIIREWGAGPGPAIIATLVAAAFGIAVYIWLARQMRIRELTSLLNLLPVPGRRR
jgi:putative peptidoglycan lipid II flippase